MRIDWREPQFLLIVAVVGIALLGIFSGKIITQFSYHIPLALLVGILIFAVTLVNTDAGLAVLIFSMLLSPEIMAGSVPGRDIVIRFDDILLMVITFSWFAKTAINKGLALFKKTPLNKAILLYLVICLMATLKGSLLGHLSPAKGFFYTLRYTEYFLLYILVVNHIHSRKQIKFFLTAFFITCALVSVYGIIQIPSGERVSAPFEGKVGEPNTFGGYLLFIFCIAVGLFLQNVSQKLKMAMIGLAVLIAFPFLYTLSRASYVGIIFSYLTLIILSKEKTVLIGMMATVILLVAIMRPEAVFSRVEYTFQEKEQTLTKIGNIYLDQSSTARVRSWRDSFETWKKNPILGRGVTSFGFIDGQYVLILPELGIVGLLAFFWLLWLIFKHSLNIYKKMTDPLYKGLALGFISSVVGLAVHALTANSFIIIRIMEPFWFIAAIVMMLPELAEEELGKEG
jgi:hypothetical protein